MMKKGNFKMIDARALFALRLDIWKKGECGMLNAADFHL